MFCVDGMMGTKTERSGSSHERKGTREPGSFSPENRSEEERAEAPSCLGQRPRKEGGHHFPGCSCISWGQGLGWVHMLSSCRLRRAEPGALRGRVRTHRDQGSAKGVEGAILKSLALIRCGWEGNAVLSGLPMWIQKRPRVDLTVCGRVITGVKNLLASAGRCSIICFALGLNSGKSFRRGGRGGAGSIPTDFWASAGLCPDPGLAPECRIRASFPRIPPLLVSEPPTPC